jgi:hypothetical protein
MVSTLARSGILRRFEVARAFSARKLAELAAPGFGSRAGTLSLATSTVIKVCRCNYAQVGIPRDLQRPFGEIAFG